MNPTDRDLLAAYLQGSPDAFHALVTRHIGMVYAKAARHSPPGTADDVTQAVFLLLAQRAKTIRNPALLPAWLLRTTAFCAAEARRSAARRATHERKAAAMLPTSTTDSPTPDSLDPHLDAALDTLSPTDRTAILLRYVHDDSLPEIAAALTLSEAATKKRLTRALEKLRTHFHRRHITLAVPLLVATLAKQATAAPPALAAKTAAFALAAPIAASAPSVMAASAAKAMAWSAAKIPVALAAGTAVLVATAAPLFSRHAPAVAPVFPIAAPVVASAPASPYPMVRSIPSAPHIPHDPPVTVEVRDAATNAPLQNVRITITEEQQEFSPETTGLTNATGTAHLVYPPIAYGSEVIAAKDGYASTGIYWRRVLPDDPAPDHFTLKMQKAQTIGGLVVDDNGNPLPGATVFVFDLSDRPVHTVDPILPRITTDATGHWSLAATPPGDRLAISASHPLCLPNIGEYQNAEAFMPDVLAGKQVIHLHRGVPISGSVHGPDGQPRQATLRVGAFSGTAQSIPPIETSLDGQFAFAIEPHWPLVIVAHAPGFADTIQILDLQDVPLHTDITLAPQSPLRAHIVDPQGNPIPNARVVITTWNTPDGQLKVGKRSISSPQTFPVSLLSDARGEIVWNDAPTQEVLANISAPGYAWTRVPLKRDGKITLAPEQVIRVRAVAAESNRPVTDFWIAPLGADDFRAFPDGSIAFNNVWNQAASPYRVMGEQYLPEPLPEIPADGRDYDITVALSEGDRIIGMLVDNHGAPIPNVHVAMEIAQPGEFENGSRFSTSVQTLQVTATDLQQGPHGYSMTDSDGRFSFSPQISAFFLYCSTDAGYAFSPSTSFTGTLTLQPWATLTGTAPHSGTVDIMRIGTPSLRTQLSTDAAGHFTIPHVAAGTYDVTPYFGAITGHTTRIRIRPGQNANVSLAPQ